MNPGNISILLFFVGLLGLATHKNIVRSIISVNIMDVGAILYLITVNYLPASVPPVSPPEGAVVADPIPQALMITAIVIGIAVSAVSLALFIALFRRYGSADWETVLKRAKR
ncbi:MAG: sodium:proton antiporter [Alkalispirochaetaceae bacterium]